MFTNIFHLGQIIVFYKIMLIMIRHRNKTFLVQDNYDDDQIDPYHGDDNKDQQAPDDMDLPDDLKLDDDNDDAGQEEEQQSQDDAGKGYLSRDGRKPVFGVSDPVLDKPACTVTEECLKLEILDLRRRGIVLFE